MLWAHRSSVRRCGFEASPSLPERDFVRETAEINAHVLELLRMMRTTLGRDTVDRFSVRSHDYFCCHQHSGGERYGHGY
jgi:hypothetical protein